MHILVITSFYPSAVRPHTGVFFKAQVEALRKAGHQVGVIAAPRIRETWDVVKQVRKWPRFTSDEGDEALYRMHRGWFPRVFPAITGFLHERAVYPVYDAYAQEHGTPDVLHAHNIFYAGWMAAALQHRHRIPAMLTEHSSNFHLGRIFLPGQHRIVRQVLPHFNIVTAVGTQLADHLHGYNEKVNVELLPNVVDTAFFQPPDTPSPTDEDAPFVVAAIGDLRALKRYDALIRAFARVFRDDERAELRIGGSGPERGALERLITATGMGDRVKLLGRLDRDEVRRTLQTAQVLASTSKVETFGVTLIEAMACGTPVIATRSGGPQGFVVPEVGILIPVDDSDALENALRDMRAKHASYDAQTIRDYCVTHFSESAVVGQLEAYYGRMVGGG